MKKKKLMTGAFLLFLIIFLYFKKYINYNVKLLKKLTMLWH